MALHDLRLSLALLGAGAALGAFGCASAQTPSDTTPATAATAGTGSTSGWAQPGLSQGAAPRGAYPQPGAPQGAYSQAAPPGYTPAAPPGYSPPAPSGVPQGGYPQPGYPQGAYPQGAYPQGAYPQGAYPQGAYPQPGYPQGAYPQPGYPPGYYPAPGTPPPAYYGAPNSYAQLPIKPARRVSVRAIVTGSVSLGVAWSLSSIIALVAGSGKGYEPLYIPVVGPFIAMGTTGAFETKNNNLDFGIFLLFDGLAQTGGLVSIILGASGSSSANEWAKSPLVPEVNVGLGSGQLTWQF